MRKSLLLVACVAAAAGSVGVVSGAAFASPKPNARPIAPGRSVTATLQNATSCTLNLTGGTVALGHLAQSVPLVIGPHSSGTWKITGWTAFGDDSADLAVIFAVTGCAQAGSEESYAMQNTDAHTRPSFPRMAAGTCGRAGANSSPRREKSSAIADPVRGDG